MPGGSLGVDHLESASRIVPSDILGDRMSTAGGEGVEQLPVTQRTDIDTTITRDGANRDAFAGVDRPGRDHQTV